MAKDSKIEWTDHTVNLWWGCAKVHTGCKNCYAEYFSDKRHKKGLWGENAKRQRILSAFPDLDRYQAQAKREGKMLKIFCGSMMDIFEESKDVTNPNSAFTCTDELRDCLFDRIEAGQYDNLVFLFLTKRPENIPSLVPIKWNHMPPRNVWFGTSVSDQATADTYVKRLVKNTVMNSFLSIEPQVGEIESLDLTHIHWVIQGGESGPKKRPFDLAWAYHIRDICRQASVPYFFKQIDKIQPIPPDLQIRQFPF